MLFNSNEFLLFFVVFAALFFFLARRPFLQNVVIVVASFIFYGTWSLPFLGLMCLTGTADYLLALAIHATTSHFKKKVILTFSLLLNLGILAYIKYSGFALDILNTWFPSSSSDRILWTVILPAGAVIHLA